MALSTLALAALVLRAVAYLASWYPGDETIRASSESFLRLMFSRSGVSFGTTKSFAFAREVTIDAGDAIKTTREAAVVQGEIARVPRWRAGEDVNVTRHAELEWRDRRADGCFFRVHSDAPASPGSANLPGPHCEHSSSVALFFSPFGQRRHSTNPAREYWPAGHCPEHVP